MITGAIDCFCLSAQAQNTIPIKARSRMRIPGKSQTAELDSISCAFYQKLIDFFNKIGTFET
jgi:hypothetical protein